MTPDQIAVWVEAQLEANPDRRTDGAFGRTALELLYGPDPVTVLEARLRDAA